VRISPVLLARAIAGEFVTVPRHPLLQFLAATAAATVILCARAPVAFVAPLLFAEDRLWSSKLVMDGFWQTAFHAREDYAILGNTILVWVGARAYEWLCAGDVFELPRCLAVTAYACVAAAMSLPILVLRRQLPPLLLATLWLLACFMPLGIHSDSWSGFEVLGRVANVGYVFLYVAFVLVWHRNANVTTGRQAIPVDLGLYVCAATNPLCLPLMPATGWPYARRLLQERKPLAAIVREPSFVSLCILAVACACAMGTPKPRAPYFEEPSPPVAFDTAVEISLARGLLYPLVWPVYGELTTVRTLQITAGFAVALALLGQRRHRAVYVGAIATIALVSVVLVACRGEVAAFFHDYRGTFPDRYFYGHNLVTVLVLVVLAADVTERLRGIRFVRCLPTAALLGLVYLAALREPLWPLSASQFRLLGDDRFVVNARRALRDGSFVDAAGNPAPDGAFVQMVVQRGCPKSLTLPRAVVERSLALRANEAHAPIQTATLPSTPVR
jgi:hypothetical protein